MDSRLAITARLREHEQRIDALLREAEIRRALDGETNPVRGLRSIAAGVRRALGVARAGWPGLNRERSRDDTTPRPGGEGVMAYSGEPAAA